MLYPGDLISGKYFTWMLGTATEQLGGLEPKAKGALTESVVNGQSPQLPPVKITAITI